MVSDFVHRQWCCRDCSGRAGCCLGNRLRHLSTCGARSAEERQSSPALTSKCISARGHAPWNVGPYDLVVSQSPLRSRTIPRRPRFSTAVLHRARSGVGRGLRRSACPRSALRQHPGAPRAMEAASCSYSPSSPNRARRSPTLASSGLDAEIPAWQWIPFGPVLSARAQMAGGHRPPRTRASGRGTGCLIRADNP